jgi:hypothetical protein
MCASDDPPFRIEVVELCNTGRALGVPARIATGGDVGGPA